MIRFLTSGLMVTCFVLILAFTIRASFQRSVFDNADLMSDVWFQVTLLDAYCGFLIFYLWVAWREKTLLGRSIWFVLIMCFGNMATAAYVLLQLFRGASDRRSFAALFGMPVGTNTTSNVPVD